MKLYKPHNLDFSTQIQGYKKKHLEKYRWIIHKIIDEQINTKDSFHGWVNLNQTLLRKFVGERYCLLILKQLQNSGIIDINHSYSTDNFSKSYKLTEEFSDVQIVSEPFKGKQAKSYLRKLNEYNMEQLQGLSKYAQQIYYNTTQINIDFVSATNYINNLYDCGSITDHQQSSYKIVTEKINDKEFYCKQDKTGRVYHNIVNLSSCLREFLSYDTSELYQLDITGSQPTLFCKLIDEYLKDKRFKYVNYSIYILMLLLPMLRQFMQMSNYTSN